MPTLAELTHYAHNPNIGVICKETHLGWAIWMGMQAEDWDYVSAVSRLRRETCTARAA